MRHILGNKYHDHDPVWHAQVTMVMAVILQLLLPDKYVFGSRYFLVGLEVLLLIALSVTTPKKRLYQSHGRRLNVFGLIILTGLANGYALSQVTRTLLAQGKIHDGRSLILAAVNIFLTNVIIFGLFYWEMDGGGPGQRSAAPDHELDFLFAQNQNESYKHPKWQPTFVDYLYVASTNAMAFSPTDTLPLSRRAKMLMLLQSVISLVTIALVAARAVNILG